MSQRKTSKYIALLVIPLLLCLVTNRLPAQETPPRPLEFAIQVAESAPDTYYLSVDPFPEATPLVMAPEDLPTVWTNLIYETYRDSNWNIYSIKPNNTNLTPLVNHPAVDTSPVFNRGTTDYLFVSNRDGNSEIYRAATNGSYTTRLTNDPASDLLPAWSPDNSQIAFQSARSGNSDIFVMDVNGNNVRQLTFTGSYDGAPSWSPDGRQLVFSSSRTGAYELWIMNADGSNQHRIPGTSPALYPSWSPLNDKIAFTRDQNNDGWLEIWTINLDGSGASMVAGGGYQTDSWLPTWSPDGEYIAYNQTSWVLYQGQYYWTHSYIYIRNINDIYESYQLSDDRAWKTHWGTADATPPTPCTINAAAQQRWPQISFGMTSTDDLSGIRSYDAQYQRAGESWIDLITNSASAGATYEGGVTGTVAFRCRATDIAGNSRSWDSAPIVSTTIDAAVPTSSVKPLPVVIQGTQATVQWEGQDIGTGIASYDVYVKDGTGDWTLWRNDATNTTAVFNGTVGHTYQFRSQATDGIGHTESWRPEADTAVTFYTTHITHTLTDNRGILVTGALVTLSPTAVYSSTTPGLFHGYLAGAASYTADWAAPGYNPLPATQHATDAPFLAVFPPVDNVLSNGDFEQPDLTPWIASNPGIQLMTEPHTGQQSVVLPGVGNAVTISQSLALPVNLHQPTLSFLYQLPAGGALSAQAETDTLFSSNTATAGWQHAWADLSAYAGQTITLTFSYTAATDDAYLDDVTIGSWHTPQITAVTPTLTQAGTTLIITGANFIAPVTALLNDTLLNSVTWVSSTQLTAQIPDEMPRGSYTLVVKNMGGATAVAPDTILVDNNSIFMPLIANNTSASNSMLKAAWPTLGQNAAHTGYQSGDPGASRYTYAWQTTIPYPGGRPLEQLAIVDGVLAATSDNNYNNNGAVVGLNAYTGQELWRYMLPDIYVVSPPTIANGSVFFQRNPLNLDSDSHLISLNLYQGTENWRVFSPSRGLDTFLAPPVADNIVYTKSENDVVAHSTLSGELLWVASRYHGGTYESWTPSVSGGRLFVFINQLLSFYDRFTGAPLGNTGTEVGWNGYTMDTAPVVAGNTAFVVGRLQLAAINLETQLVEWSIAGDYSETMPVIVDNEVYALRDGELEVRQVGDGALQWGFSGDSNLINAPVVTDNYVYVASAEHTYVVRRPAPYHPVVWQVNKGGWLSVADGYLYIAQPDKTITAYRAQEP
jgi:hypothetical protein